MWIFGLLAHKYIYVAHKCIYVDINTFMST